MDSYLTSLFTAGQYIPQGTCLLWQPGLMWLHAASDALIALAYFSIPIALLYFVSKRKDMPSHGMFLLFGLFILACGTTHLMAIVTVWDPLYRLDGLIKAVTAVVALPTAMAIWWLMPAALHLPRQEQLVTANGALLKEIAERTRAEAALAKSEAKFRTMFRDSAMGMALSSPTGELLETNNAFCEFVGYSQNELATKTVGEITDPEDRVACTREIEDTLAGKISAFRTEKRFVHKSGEKKWSETTVSLVRDPRGEPEYFFAQVLDSTERKRAEEAIRRSEAALRSFVDAAPYGIYRASDELDAFLSVNPALMKMLGYDAALDILALKLSTELYCDADGRERFLSRLMQTNAFVAMELQWKRKDGKPLTVKVRARRVRDPLSGDEVIEGVAEDVTDRRALRAQLLQAQKMEAVGRLTGGVAHDFNNLLCVIVGNLEMLAEDNNDRKVSKNLIRLALRAAMSGSDLTQRLLAFSRRQPLRPETVNMHKLIGEFSVLLRRSLGEMIAVKTNIQPGLWPCFVDPNQLESALLNLAVNARDAMPEGGRISIEMENVALRRSDAQVPDVMAPGEYVKLSVSDEGEGMTEEVQQRAFEPFFTTKGDKGGSGLGLSMVYGFIKQSGGHVTIDSKIGRGTTVSIFLPRALSDVRSSPDEFRQALSGAFNATGSVLVVEDRSDVRAMACRMLAEFGLRVFAASDASKALAVLDQIDDLRLLFTDVILPGNMNGPELAKEVVRRRPSLKVLYTSGYIANSKMCNESDGANTHLLIKPYRKEDMARMLRLVLAD